MILLDKNLPYLSAAIVLVSYEILLWKPASLYFIIAILFLNIILSIYRITERKFISKVFGHFLLSPLLFIISCSTTLLFLENNNIKQIFIVGSSLIYLLILLNIYAFLHQTEKYQPYTLENLSSYVNLISVFLFYASFFSFGLFISAPVWLLAILAFIITILISYQTLWANKIDFKRARLFILIIGIILTELYWCVDFLPTSYFVNAVILIIFYYIVINISRDYLLNVLNKKSVRRYLIVSFLVLILTLATAPWI